MGESSDYAPLAAEACPSEIAGFRQGFAGQPVICRKRVRHPFLLAAMAALREHVVSRIGFGPELPAVEVLRAGRELGSSYERSRYNVRARPCGFCDARLPSIMRLRDGMAAADVKVAQAVNEMCDHHELSEYGRGDLQVRVGQRGVLDLIAAVGVYSVLWQVLDHFNVPLDEDVADILRRKPV